MISAPLALKSLFATLLILVGAAGVSAAQTPASLENEFAKLKAKSEELFARLTEPRRRQLERVIEQLRQADPQAKDWDKMISQLRIEVPRIDWREGLEEADALARLGADQSPTVRVNQLAFMQLIDQSDGAAGLLIADMTGSELKAAQEPMFRGLAEEIHSHVLAWVFAHEIAHHRLGHTKTPRKSLPDSRERELAADWHSFELLNRAGYSVPLLFSYFEFVARLEEARVRAGKKLDETLMTHPSWGTRRTRLREYMGSNPPPRQRWMMFSVFTRFPTGLTKATYFLPADGTLLGFVWVYGEQGMLPAGVEYLADGRGARIYQRFHDDVLVNYVEDVDAHVTYLRTYPPKAWHIKESVVMTYRDSFGGAAASDEQGLIGSAMQTSSLEPILQALDRVTDDPRKREAGIRIYRERGTALSHNSLRFFKGELSLQGSIQQEHRIKASYATQLEETLGRETVQAVDAEVLRWTVQMLQRRGGK